MAVDNILRITKAGFSEEGYGTFDPGTLTATLKTSCEKTISIESNGITLTSDGAKINAAAQNGIRLVNVCNIHIHNIEIYHSKMGIYAGVGRNLRIEDVHFFGCTYGMSFEHMDGIMVSSCRFREMVQEAISGERSSNLTLSRLQIQWSPQGIVINGSKNIVVENNLITTDLYSCIAIANSANLSVKDNLLFGGEEIMHISQCMGNMDIINNRMTTLCNAGGVGRDTANCVLSERCYQTNEARRHKMALMDEF